MYGFGDDRNPSNDTVNVMEEILIEYIIDVVRIHRVLLSSLSLISPWHSVIVSSCACTREEISIVNRGPQEGIIKAC